MVVQTPPMGWNSWNTFGEKIDEELIKKTADVMAESGLLDAGYDYLVIDDCWSEKKRDENGRLVPDKNKFPNGMKAVADYVHSKGLKFGMYSCNGNLTCAQYPGSFEYEFIDAQTFAEWGVDFLKYDNCFKPHHQDGHLLYKRMGLALANCGRNILFSACNWGVDNSKDWIKSTGAHMWRSTGDINDSWASVKDIAYQQKSFITSNGQGCFNDMDMLIVGMNGKGNVGVAGCNYDEYKTHFSLWAMFNSPLMVGCDIREMDDAAKEILLNKEVIAINQDKAQRQPFVCGSFWTNEDVWCYAKFLEGGDIALGIFNLTDGYADPYISLDTLGINRSTGKALEIRDLWAHKDLGTFTDIFKCEPLTKGHDCHMFRARIVDAE